MARERSPIADPQRVAIYLRVSTEDQAERGTIETQREFAERYAALGRPDLPIRVVVRPEQQARYASLLSKVQVWDHSPTVADLDGFAAEVEAADRPGVRAG